MGARFRSVAVLAVCLFGLIQPLISSAQSPGQAKTAVPVDPVGAIVEAFQSHQLVAVGDNHGSNEGHAFRLALIRDARTAGIVNDVVVEFGNARYQELMDRFVGGGAVTDEDLRRVWQDTTQVEETWDLSIYEEFFRAVRTVNAARSSAQQIRVLLGDPPINWNDVHSAEDLRKAPDRDAYAVDVIRTEVLARKRRALIIYGDQHLVRKNTVVNAPDEWARGIVARLEMAKLASVFSVHTESRMDLAALQPDIASWPRPSLAMLAGTTIGQVVADPGPGRRPVRTEEQFDAVLYLGPPGTLTTAQLSPATCANESYVLMRSSRLALLPAPSNAPFDPSDRIRVICAFPTETANIADGDPHFTTLVRETIAGGRTGTVDPTRFAPELRPRLVLFFQTYAVRILGPMGELTSLTLIGEATIAGKRLRRYRAEFEKGKMIWTVGVAPDGTIASMDPKRG